MEFMMFVGMIIIFSLIYSKQTEQKQQLEKTQEKLELAEREKQKRDGKILSFMTEYLLEDIDEKITLINKDKLSFTDIFFNIFNDRFELTYYMITYDGGPPEEFQDIFYYEDIDRVYFIEGDGEAFKFEIQNKESRPLLFSGTRVFIIKRENNYGIITSTYRPIDFIIENKDRVKEFKNRLAANNVKFEFCMREDIKNFNDLLLIESLLGVVQE